VIDTLLVVRAILSISSMNMMPCCALLDVVVAEFCSSFRMMFSTSSPT
jgi:hypothetical protein